MAAVDVLPSPRNRDRVLARRPLLGYDQVYCAAFREKYFKDSMDKEDVIALLGKHGIDFLRDCEDNAMLFEHDGVVFRVVWGKDWNYYRWMCAIAHVDSILRKAQSEP